MKFSIIILISWLTLSACGNKGDLYLPEKNTSTEENRKPDTNKDENTQ